MITDRAVVADKNAKPEKSPRIVMLRATYETQDKLREWAKAEGFDLAWSHSGWPQSSYDFDFHITIVASEKAVRAEDGARFIDPVTVTPSGFVIMGDNTPALAIEPNTTLTAIREFFVATFGMVPTYPDFRPHISLSYRWTGEPAIAGAVPPSLPPFPLVFDTLMIARFEPAPAMAKDAASLAPKVMHAADRSAIAGTRRTTDGYLVTDARVARGGNIQDYYGHEIGEGEPNQLFKVWRPEDEIFKRDSLTTFAHKPVTLGHPTVEVTPESWRRDAIGHVGSEVVRDGEFVRVPLVVMDATAIAEIEDGTREISMGYDCELVMRAGTTPDGRAYDAYQKNIRINHCAIVPAGRAGPQCRIGDSAARINSNEEGNTMAKSVTIDGKTFEVADDMAALVSSGKLADTLIASAKALDDARAALTAANARADVAEKAVGDLKAKLEAAEKATPTADAIAKMAADLAAVCDAAKAIAPKIETKGKTADAIKAEVVAIALGDAAKGKDAAYVAVAFDLLTKSNDKADPVALAISKAATGVADVGTKAADAYAERMANAWKGAA